MAKGGYKIRYEEDIPFKEAKLILKERAKASKIMRLKLRFIGVPR